MAIVATESLRYGWRFAMESEWVSGGGVYILIKTDSQITENGRPSLVINFIMKYRIPILYAMHMEIN